MKQFNPDNYIPNNKVEALEKLLEPLPKTANGIPVYPRMKVFRLCRYSSNPINEMTLLYVNEDNEAIIEGCGYQCCDCGNWDVGNTENLSDLYSSYESAEVTLETFKKETKK